MGKPLPTSGGLRRIIRPFNGTDGVLSFLTPSFPLHQQSRSFSSSVQKSIQVGRLPISIPEGVSVRVLEPPVGRNARIPRGGAIRTMEVEGPLGKVSMQVPPYLKIRQDEQSRQVKLNVKDQEERKQREMWGTLHGYLHNHMIGVSEGHTAIVRLVGIGYRASIEKSAIGVSPTFPGQEFVSAKLGYPHPVELGIPQGVKASTPQPTRILLEGPDKAVVTQFAARIRSWRKPEPYKGKGVFVNDETIQLKAKKIK